PAGRRAAGARPASAPPPPPAPPAPAAATARCSFVFSWLFLPLQLRGLLGGEGGQPDAHGGALVRLAEHLKAVAFAEGQPDAPVDVAHPDARPAGPGLGPALVQKALHHLGGHAHAV